MSLAPVSYAVYSTKTASSTRTSTITAYVSVNYVQCISATQVMISTYHNRSYTGSVNWHANTGEATFYSGSGGGAIGSYTGDANNNTHNTTVAYFSQITGPVTTTLTNAYDNYYAGYLSASTGISLTVNFFDITKQFTTVTTSGYYIGRLPAASSCIGKLFFIKNLQPIGYIGVSTISTDETIDGFSLNQIRLQLESTVCITAVSNTKWSILSYWHGVGIPSTQISSYPQQTAITSPIVTVDIGSGNKWLEVPFASTWGAGSFLIINAFQTSTTSPSYTCYVHVGQRVLGYYDYSPNYYYFTLKPDADLNGLYDHNASVILLSDGTYWNIAGFFNGAGCYFDRNVNSIPANGQTTAGIVTHGGGAWATLHSSPVSSGWGRLYFTKMNATTTTDWGVIVGYSGLASTIGVVGTTAGSATGTGSISGTTLTMTEQTAIIPGTIVQGAGVAAGTYVTGGNYNYSSGTFLRVFSLNSSQTVSSTALTFTHGYGRVYKNNPGTRDYSGFAMCQAIVSNVTVHFPIAMYPSSY